MVAARSAPGRVTGSRATAAMARARPWPPNSRRRSRSRSAKTTSPPARASTPTAAALNAGCSRRDQSHVDGREHHQRGGVDRGTPEREVGVVEAEPEQRDEQPDVQRAERRVVSRTAIGW